MKKIILASLLLAGIASCKKEIPTPPANNNPVTAVHENYVILNGDGHNNDTLQLPHLLSANVHGDSVNIQGNDTTGYAATSNIPLAVGLVDIPLTSGSHSISVGNLSVIYASPISYAPVSATVTISSVGSPGGYITGTYSGNFQRGNPPYNPITVSGKFSVIRN